MTQYSDAKREDVGRLIAGPDFITAPTTDTYINGPASREFVAGATITATQAVILNSSSKWVLTDANTASLYNGLKGIAAHGASSDEALVVALPGSILYHTSFATLTVGTSYFLSETAGAITATMPTTGTSGQIEAGVAVHADKLFVTMRPAVAVSGA